MHGTIPSTAFYIAADSRHYVGLVALINSLRLVGHDEPIFVGDCGLVGVHRHMLADHVTLVETDGARTPHVAKMVAPLAYPSEVAVLIDADIIVTRPLTGLIDRARAGRIVAFADRVDHRFDVRWSELLGIGPLRPGPYVNSGLVAAERTLAAALLENVARGCEQIDVERTVIANGRSDYPFYYLDQDVVNAFLGTYPPETRDVLEHRLAPFPPFPGLRVVDDGSLRCSYRDGVEPFALHHIAKKPWTAPQRWSVYSRLLGRLLLSEDVALRLRVDEIPLRLRPGAVAWLEKRRSDVLATVGGMRGKLGIRRKLAGRAGRRA